MAYIQRVASRAITAVCGLYLATTCILPRQSHAQARGSSQHFLLAGDHGQDYSSALTGSPWFGLYKSASGGQHFLVPASVAVQRIAVCGGDVPGSRVTAQPSEGLILLVRGAQGLRRGVVETVFSGDTILLPGQTIRVSLGQSTYVFGASGTISGRGRNPTIRDYRLTLSLAGGPPEVLESKQVADYDYGYSRLLWAGDLDRDGELDILTLNPGSALTLRLSSLASEGVLTFPAISC